MSNHPNRNKSGITISVKNASGEEFPNLVGVFKRAFPIACGSVRNGIKESQVVWLNDIEYLICKR